MTGLVAQQQCVGPLHTPLADVAVVALSPFGLEGAATSIGEQPVKGLVCPAAGARMAVGEALTNLVFARVTALKVMGGRVQGKARTDMKKVQIPCGSAQEHLFYMLVFDLISCSRV